MAATYIADRYKLKKKDIGGGNMASIHLCVDIDVDDETNSSVIVKMFNKPNIGDEDLQKRVFNREVESLERLNHKNIVKILDRGFDENFNAFFIVLEYIDGQNFKDAFDEISRFSYAQKLELMKNVIEGIEYLHKRNVVHRDLKPSNLMIDKDGTVKIIDFGISKLQDTFYSDYTLAAYATKQYCSPEQLSGKTITNQSDIFSLGYVFYEIFTSSHITTRESMDISGLPVGMQNILVKMTQEEPRLRYLTITEVKRDVEKEMSLLTQEKYISLGVTTNVKKRLHTAGYIGNEDDSLAMIVLNEEYAGKCYMHSQKNHETGLFEDTYHLYGKRFISILKYDQMDPERFTIVGISFVSADRLMTKKEFAYEIPYGIKVRGTSRVKYNGEIDAQVLGEEVLEYESNYNNQFNEKMLQKNIVRNWKYILELEKKQISEEKSTLPYKNLKVNEEDYSIEIDINTNASYELNYTPDDVLQMTSQKSIFRYIDVGHMRECSNNHMKIDLNPQVDYSNIASSGEISISMRMAEIALDRQRKALKSIQFKENANPEISDIIFDPSKATSKNNLMLSGTDCKSKEIDQSKLVSLEKALSSEDIFLLQGPPGTGKTTFIAELVSQIINGNRNYRGNPDAKILIASQSHVAVDHSLDKIKKLLPDIKMIRIGILDKLSESAREYTLDIFCKEWTKNVIENCKKALENYKKEIGLDDSLQEKNSIINEIENLRAEMASLIDELAEVETELEKVNVLDFKWQFINEKIVSMKKMVSIKTAGVTEEHLSRIIENFTDDLSLLNSKLASVIDESIALSEQKQALEERNQRIIDELATKGEEEQVWKELLGVSNHEEYLETKQKVEGLIKENQKKYGRYSKVESLSKEWQKRVAQGDGLLQESIADATLVGATCLGIASISSAINFSFDWVIVDEAGKATPPEIMVPICLGKKIVLVGDHKQLPPVVDEELLKHQEKGGNITKEDLEISLFEYLEKSLNSECKSILDEQYRMNPVIGDLISALFYENKLISRTSRAEKTIPLKLYNNKPLVWLSTSSIPDRKEERVSDSFRNSVEAKIIYEQLLLIDMELNELGLEKEIAIIAGYRGQRDQLTRLYESDYRARFHNMTIEINTVDAFQGRETDIVFYSIVRSNDTGNLGFLKDVRRLNVAFSRARELLVVVGDHQCAQRRLEIGRQENPFVGIIKYIFEHSDDCLLKEVLDK